MRALAWLGALVAADVHSACVGVAGASLASADPHVVAQQCAQQRPAKGFWLAQAMEDCEQFGTMLRLAKRLNSGITATDFCADVHDPDAGGLLAAHSQCMHMWATAVDAPAVQAALQNACETGHGPACALFASALHELPVENRRSLCDHTVTNGTGTWALDNVHFQYSCREFSLNCAGNRTCAPEAVARCAGAGFPTSFCDPFADLVQKVRSGEANAKAAEDFCKSQAEKEDEGSEASEPAPVTAAVLAAAAPAAATSAPAPVATAAPVAAVATAAPAAAVAAPAPAAAAAAPAPVAAVAAPPAADTAAPAAAEKEDPEAAVTDCMEHTRQMLQLGLGAEELQHVAGEVCAKKYAAGICGNFTSLVSKAAATTEEPAKATALHDACRVAISENPFDMFSVCKQAVVKVEGTELEGDAFQKASFEVCTRLLEHEMQSVDAPIADGCTYFSGQLAAARSKGPVKAETFCTQLTSQQDSSAPEDVSPKAEHVTTDKASVSSLVEEVPKVVAAKAAPDVVVAEASTVKAPVVTPAPAAKESVKAAVETKAKTPKASLMQGGRKVLLRKHTEIEEPAVKASSDDDAFLNHFLDDFEATEGKPQTLQQRVDKAFPETAQADARPAAAPAATQPAAQAPPPVQAVAQPADDVISDFLSNYDEVTK